MTARKPRRWDRLYETKEDQREPAQKDRDRILYTSALRRLAGVTQVVGATEGHTVHNRLTHSLEVAQIARRLAEHLRREQPALSKKYGLDPDVAESAALAHDLGHPPFGHVAEKALNRLVTAHGCEDGFEGNAQSFRIVTALALCGETDSSQGQYGLDLTRATLNAVLKYPWSREEGRANGLKKWGYNEIDEEAFRFARQGPYESTFRPSLEAQVMTVADDIAYSVHDTEDFFRAGLIPLDRLINDRNESGERNRFLETAATKLQHLGSRVELSKALASYLERLAIDRPFQGTRSDRIAIRRTTSSLIGRYLLSVRIVENPSKDDLLTFDDPYELEIEIAKQLTWYYVIDSPLLATQQAGTSKVITTLFETYYAALDSSDPRISLIPAAFREQADEWLTSGVAPSHRARLVSDIICNMTDYQALCMFQRISGQSPGTFFDPAFR